MPYYCIIIIIIINFVLFLSVPCGDIPCGPDTPQTKKIIVLDSGRHFHNIDIN